MQYACTVVALGNSDLKLDFDVRSDDSGLDSLAWTMS